MSPVSDTAIAKIRARTEGSMDGLVTILRGKPGTLNKATGRVSGITDARQIYGDPVAAGTIGTVGGKARVHTVTGQGSLSLGPGQIDVRQTTVSIPWDADPVYRDDIVLVRSAGRDSSLTGATLRVVEVAGGTLFGDARRLSCTLWGRSAYWDGDGS
jgi:hypothetical protein